MERLLLHWTTGLAADAGRWRRLVFAGQGIGDCARDAWDDRSDHVEIRRDRELAAYARLTLGPNGFFATWTQGEARIPTGPDVADLGRCFVVPEFRGLGLMRVICLEALSRAEDRGCRAVVGGVVPGSRWGTLLEEIGLEACGPTVAGRGATATVHFQPLVCDVVRHAPRWTDFRNRALERLERSGFSLEAGASDLGASRSAPGT
jgi:GNAT superfamily N-acetyltransferase